MFGKCSKYAVPWIFFFFFDVNFLTWRGPVFIFILPRFTCNFRHSVSAWIWPQPIIPAHSKLIDNVVSVGKLWRLSTPNRGARHEAPLHYFLFFYFFTDSVKGRQLIMRLKCHWMLRWRNQWQIWYISWPHYETGKITPVWQRLGGEGESIRNGLSVLFNAIFAGFSSGALETVGGADLSVVKDCWSTGIHVCIML